MSQAIDATCRITNLIDLLRTCSGLRIDARTVETSPESDSDTPALTVEIFGEDAPLFLRDDGELLAAVHHLAAEMLRLAPRDEGLLKFEVDRLRPERREELRRLASRAVVTVRRTLRPYSFVPMTSAERRILHLALAAAGLQSASAGHGVKRFVVVYPEGVSPVGPPRELGASASGHPSG